MKYFLHDRHLNRWTDYCFRDITVFPQNFNILTLTDNTLFNHSIYYSFFFLIESLTFSFGGSNPYNIIISNGFLSSADTGSFLIKLRIHPLQQKCYYYYFSNLHVSTLCKWIPFISIVWCKFSVQVRDRDKLNVISQCTNHYLNLSGILV